MKRVTVLSPSGDELEVTPDQVQYLCDSGWTLKSDKPVKSKKTPKEVIKDGNIQR